MPESTRDYVCEAIREVLGKHPHDIKDSDSLVESYGADSLDHLEILMELEDNLRIQIEDADFEACKTVKDVLDLVQRLR